MSAAPWSRQAIACRACRDQYRRAPVTERTLGRQESRLGAVDRRATVRNGATLRAGHHKRGLPCSGDASARGRGAVQLTRSKILKRRNFAHDFEVSVPSLKGYVPLSTQATR